MRGDGDNIPERPLEDRLRAYGDSALRRSHEALAADAPPVSPAELDDLVEGRVFDEHRARALAEQLVAGPDWEAQLAQLDAEQARRGRRGVVLTLFAGLAAAAMLLLMSDLGGDARGARLLLDHARFTGPSGLELRGDALGEQARVRIEVGSAGQLALVLAGVDGSLRAETVSGQELWAPVVAGEDIVLPLDGSLPAVVGETWIVLMGSGALGEADTVGLARRALDDELPSTVSAQLLQIGG